MSLTRRRARMLGTTALAGLGLVLLAIPLYDVWEDIYRQGEIPLSTLAENALPALLSGILIAAAFWFRTTDWDDAYVDTVLGWCAAALGGALVMHVWVLGIQLFVQNKLKPFVIAADTIVAASVAGLAVGVYSAKSARRKDELETERDRLSALFENTTDAIAVVDDVDETPVLAGANDRFKALFGVDESDYGRAIGDVVIPSEDPVEHGVDDIVSKFQSDGELELEVRRETVTGARDFLLRVFPRERGSESEVYAVYTDITERKELHRTRRERDRIEYLHGVASDLEATQDEDAVYEQTVNAAVEVFDLDAGVVVRNAGENGSATDVAAAVDADAPRDPKRISTLASGASPVLDPAGSHVVLTAPIDGFATLQAWGEATLRTEATSTAELLVTHASQAVQRVRRENQIEDERERLEFVNRILRHNLLNGMNVVQARLDLLRDHVDDDVRTHFETVEDRVDDMADLVETMRTFMKTIVENEDHELHPVDLRSVVRDELDRARNAFPDATFEVDGDLPPVEVAADDLLGEVFENLLTNAVQHNDTDRPRVTVDADVDRGSGVVRVHVRDNGPGIPDEQKAEIFEKGVKGLQSPGTGFGLYLVHQILDSYDASVSVRDNDPRGADFVLTLPIS